MRLFLALLGLFWATATSAQDLVIRGGTLINPDGSAPVTDAVIVVRDGRIVSVGRLGFVRIPADVEVLDATGKWIVPGYIDSHVHFFQSGGLYTRPDGLDLRSQVPYEAEIAAIQRDLERTFARYLASGVTAVADVGGPMWNYTVRERSLATERAPRVAATGPLISTWRPPVLADVPDLPIIAAETPEEARALVRAQLARRPDYIKIWFVVPDGRTADELLPVVRAAIEAAHASRLRVAVHATELETARAAVQAGADILVHGVEDAPVDAGFVALLRERGVIYMTTLDVASGYLRSFTQQPGFTEREYALGDPRVMGTLSDLRHLPDAAVPAPIRALRGRTITEPRLAILLQNLRTVRDAGIPVAMGTDAGNIGTLPGPSIYREFALMARAGMTPREILASATVNGARVMGREADLGTVARGRLADMVLLDADPSADAANLSRIFRVVRGGRAYRQDELVAATPEDVVQRQVNAYNARDIEAFLATYHPDARLYGFPDRLERQGHAAMREVYGPMFAALPDLHVQIPRRIVSGNYVIDEEIVTGVGGQAAVRATAIYEVRDGLIARVWFIEGAAPAESAQSRARGE